MRPMKPAMEQKLNALSAQHDQVKKLLSDPSVVSDLKRFRELSKEYYRTIATGNEKKINELTAALRNLEERGGKFHELQKHLALSTKEYAALQSQYNTVVTDSEKSLTYTNVVVKPYPSDKKAYPVRWLIVTIATCATLLFTVL